jgi:hypothetical protein
MRVLDGWQSWVRRTRRFGVAAIVALVLTGAATGTSVQGAAQRVAATFVTAGVAVLALRIARGVRRDQLINS